MKKIDFLNSYKYNINFNNMFKYGSIASISMLFIILFFGNENIMLAFPITLIAIAISFENIRVNTLKKTFYFICLNTLLIILSYFASKHIYIGLLINFLTIFFISFFLTFSYNIKIYKPFLMLFIFTSFSHDTLSELYYKILAGIFGVILVVVISLILDISKSKNPLLYEFESCINNIIDLLTACINDKFDINAYNKTCQSLRKISYDVYINRNNKALTHYEDKLKIDMYLHLNYIANFLYRNFYKTNKHTNELKELLSSFLKSLSNFDKQKIKTLNRNLSSFCYNTNFKSTTKTREFINIIKNLNKTLNTYRLSSKRKLKSHYLDYKKSRFDRYSYALKSHFLNSTRIRFSLRMSITLTTCLFFSHLISFSKIIWISITIMSVMQIYYEETIIREKERIKGNIIGILIFSIIGLIHIRFVSILVLIVSLYLTYAFKEYYKLSIFTSLASLSVTSLYSNIHEVALYRITLVILGLVVVVLANKFLFKTKLEDGIDSLISQILFYDGKFIDFSTNTDKDKKKFLAEILLLSSLTTEKLYSRNQILKNNKINWLILKNNLSMIDLAYLELIR